MKATIKDISQDLGVSVNTVYKALNDKPKVSEETRKKVIDKAKELNYKPNKLAQGLARSVKRIGLILPKYPESFTRYIVKGIEEIENDLYDYNIHSIINQTSTNQETMEVSNELIEKNVDGIIILFSEMSLGIKSLLDEKSKCDLPVVGIVSEPLDHTPLVGMVRVSGHVLGCMAAQILSLSIDKKKQLAIFLPDENAVQHTECYESFIRACITHGISSTVLCRASLKDKIITYEATEQIINNNKNIGGIYVASNNAVGVCKCLEDMGRTDIAVLGHDLYPELAECITRGSLLATLFQNQSLQVKRAVEKMIEYITNEKKPFGTVFLRPELVMKSNLDCYTDQY